MNIRQTLLAWLIGILFLAGCAGTLKGKVVATNPDPFLMDEQVQVVPMRYGYPESQAVAFLESEQFLLCRRKAACPIKRDFTPRPVLPPVPEPVLTLPVRRKLDLPMKAIVHFPTGSPALDQAALVTLNKIASELSGGDLPPLRIVIAGYTDSEGSTEINKKLAEDRAGAVSAYFREKSIIPKQSVTGGRALCCYVAPNTTTEGRTKNRRAEIWVEQTGDSKDEKPN